MEVEFYFDPLCPYSWIASRWLLRVQNKREIKVNWLPFSLAIKNNAKTGKETSHAATQLASLKLLRVILKAQADHKVSLIDAYSSAGNLIHIEQQELNDELIKQFLESLQLPYALFTSVNDSSFDDILKQNIEQAVTVTGKDVGVPIIIFNTESGQRQGYFGPVFNQLPSPAEELPLWDALSVLASSPSFYELKRQLPSGEPDVGSTAVC